MNKIELARIIAARSTAKFVEIPRLCRSTAQHHHERTYKAEVIPNPLLEKEQRRLIKTWGA